MSSGGLARGPPCHKHEEEHVMVFDAPRAPAAQPAKPKATPIKK